MLNMIEIILENQLATTN